MREIELDRYRRTGRHRQDRSREKKKRKEIARRGAPKRLDEVFGTRVRLEMFGGRHLYRRRCRRCGRLRTPPPGRAPRGCRPIEGGDYYWVRAHRAPPPAAPVAAPLLLVGGAAVAARAGGRTVVRAACTHTRAVSVDRWGVGGERVRANAKTHPPYIPSRVCV